MSASQVLNALTYYSTLAPSDALSDPNFCNQCKTWKLVALNLLLNQLCPTQMAYWAKNYVIILTRTAHWMTY